MLKLLPPDTNKFFNFKCGEIFCLTSTTYNVACCLCGSKVSFEDFRKHFQEEHLSDTEQRLSALQEEIDSSSIEKENKNDYSIKNENEIIDIKDDDELEDEKPFDIEELQWSKTETCVAEIDFGMPSPKCEFLSDEDGEVKTKTDDDIWENDDFNDGDDSDEDWQEKQEKAKEKEKKNDTFACDLCERVYKSKRSLQNHIRVNHNPERSQKEPQLKHKCDECGQVFRSERHLRGHKWKHTGIHCDICGKPFTQTGNMLRHKIRHTGIKSHKCQECGNLFYTDKELRAHMLRHTGIMPIICEICGRPCRDHGVLTAHMRRHTGERPAKCEVCGKCFYSFHDLNVHAVTHSSARPFACDICGSTFQRKKSLRVHKKLHSKERKHECKVCGKAFAQSGGLNAHMRTHDPATRKPAHLTISEKASVVVSADTGRGEVSGDSNVIGVLTTENVPTSIVNEPDLTVIGSDNMNLNNWKAKF